MSNREILLKQLMIPQLKGPSVYDAFHLQPPTLERLKLPDPLPLQQQDYAGYSPEERRALEELPSNGRKDIDG